MRQSDRDRLLEVLAGVYAFYGKDLSQFSCDVWVQACESYEVEQVTKALSAHLMDPERGQWLPKPADLVRQLVGTQTDRALVAWGKTLDAMRRVGAYSDVVFDDPIIHAVIVDLGGWVTMCRSEVDELPHTQRRFCDSYRAYARRGDVSYQPRLTGEHSAHNALRGFAQGVPTLVGDVAKAQAVMSDGSASPTARVAMLRALEQHGRTPRC